MLAFSEQLAPRSESGGVRGLDGNYEGATAELDRLTAEVQVGHDAPKSELTDARGLD